jgi:hypothetical protein
MVVFGYGILVPWRADQAARNDPLMEDGRAMILRNLILVYRKDCVDPTDFKHIARSIGEKAPDIQVFIIEDFPVPLPLVARAASRPTLIFSPLILSSFIPARGRICCGRRIPKLQQMPLMRRVGVPVPDWAPILPESRFPAADWGNLVVVKPAGRMLASYARGVELQLTEHVEFRPPTSYPKTHPGHYGPMFVQRFIDTGPYPAKIRVLTLFGTPLYAEEIRSEDPQIIPDPPTADALQSLQITVVNGPRTRRFVFDSDVLELARDVYRAAPFIPLQGCDFIREAGTGNLYALEFNPGGNTWHFSSKEAGHHRIEGKKREEQFNAFDLAADVLIAQTRASAI